MTRLRGWLTAAGAFGLGLVVLAIGLELAGYDAATALAALWRGAFGSWYAVTTATLVRSVPLIIIGLGIAICGAVIVWGGIEKTLAGANTDAEHRAQKRITNGIMGLVWMVLAGVIVSTITAIAVAYGLIEKPF